MQGRVDLVIDRIPALGADLGLQIGLSLEQAIERLLVGFRHVFVDGVQLLMECIEFLECSGGGLSHGVRFLEFRVLREVSDSRSLLKLDRARVRFHVPPDESHQCRLAGTIATDQPDLLTSFDGEDHAIENDACAVGVSDIGDREQ